MPRLACRSCGRQIYAVAPLAAMFAEERRCPRCGASLHDERREAPRRASIRRLNPADDPGPPRSAAGRGSAIAGERRAADRRTVQRRRGEPVAVGGRASSSVGWRD